MTHARNIARIYRKVKKMSQDTKAPKEVVAPDDVLVTILNNTRNTIEENLGEFLNSMVGRGISVRTTQASIKASGVKVEGFVTNNARHFTNAHTLLHKPDSVGQLVGSMLTLARKVVALDGQTQESATVIINKAKSVANVVAFIEKAEVDKVATSDIAKRAQALIKAIETSEVALTAEDNAALLQVIALATLTLKATATVSATA